MQYVTVFQSKLDQHPVIALGRQIKPSNPFWLSRCFEILVKDEENPINQYIFIDAHQDSNLDKSLQVRTRIFDKNPLFFVMNEKN